MWNRISVAGLVVLGLTISGGSRATAGPFIDWLNGVANTPTGSLVDWLNGVANTPVCGEPHHDHHSHPEAHAPFFFVTPNGKLSSNPIFNYPMVVGPIVPYQAWFPPPAAMPMSIPYPTSFAPMAGPNSMPPFSAHLPGNYQAYHGVPHHYSWPGR